MGYVLDAPAQTAGGSEMSKYIDDLLTAAWNLATAHEWNMPRAAAEMELAVAKEALRAYITELEAAKEAFVTLKSVTDKHSAALNARIGMLEIALQQGSRTREVKLCARIKELEDDSEGTKEIFVRELNQRMALTTQNTKLHRRIDELEAALKGLALAAANDMRHNDDNSDMGWLALKELSDALSVANHLTQPMPEPPEVK